MFESLSRIITNIAIRNPWHVVLVATCITVLIGLGNMNLTLNTSYRIFFTDENPQLQIFDHIEQSYGKSDSILFTIKPDQGDVFQEEVLSFIQDLTRDSWHIPYAQRVDSISNFQQIHDREGKLYFEPLLPESALLTEDMLYRIRIEAMEEPTILGKLLSENAKAAAVSVLIDYPRDNPKELMKITDAARKLVDKYRANYPHIEIRPSGMVFLNHAFIEATLKDFTHIVPLMIIILAVTTLLFLQSIAATLATMTLVLFSSIVAMGFGGWLGYPLTPPSAVTPTIVLTLAIADSIHIIVHMLRSMHRGMGKEDAIRESMRINLHPIFLTSFTTAIGFLALNYAESPPFWHLGNMTAFGVTMAFLYSIFFLPACLMLLPMHEGINPPEKRPIMLTLGSFVLKYRKSLLFANAMLALFLSMAMVRIEINDKFIDYFDASIPFRPDSEFLLRYMTGIYTLDYSVDAKGPSKIYDPDYLDYVEVFSHWLRRQPEVFHVHSVTDTLKQVNQAMHQGDYSWYHIPNKKDLIEEYVSKYEVSVPQQFDLKDRVNQDRSAIRLMVILQDISSNEIQSFKVRSEEWFQKYTPDYMVAEASSPILMFSTISSHNIMSMMKGNILSLFLISGCICIAFRSIKIGLISLIPNFVPILMGYGFWGLFIGEINMAVAIAAAVSLGIIVDDTVHFLCKYHRAREERGLDVEEAVRYSFHVVGTAIVITSLILIFGFGVLTYSAFQVNAYLGLLNCLVIGSALLADFFLLPPLLAYIDRSSKDKNIS